MQEDNLAIHLCGVGYQIDGLPILKDISWTVVRGERWTVLGPNGSGKTSLLGMVAGYAFPSRGRVEVLGRRFGQADLRDLRQRVGWVHGDLRQRIPDFMSAQEVVLSGARGSLVLYEAAGRQEREGAAEHLAALGAAHLRARLFFSLSTGERQRVLIARALMADAQLLLLDEPCLGLDPLCREEFLSSLSGLLAARRDLTVVSVTHQVEEITPDFQKVLVLKEGGVLAAGGKDAALRQGIDGGVFGPRCRLICREGRYQLRFR